MEDPTRPKRRFTIGGRPVDQLDSHLLAASAQAARYAMANYSSQDWDAMHMSAIRCGMAVEYQLLSALAAESPALLAGTNGRPSLLARMVLAGVAHPKEVTAETLRTIDAEDAFDAVQLIYPQLKLDRKRFQRIMSVRNAAAHMALVETEPLQQAIGAMAAILEQLLNVRGIDRAHFWTQELLFSVTVTVGAEASAGLRRAQTKIAAARAKLDSLLVNVNLDQRPALLAILEDRTYPTRWNGDPLPRECPACLRRGWLTYLVMEDATALTVDEDQGHVEYKRIGLPEYFDCPVCGLALEDEELQFSGLGEEIELEPGTMPISEAFANDEPLRAI